MAQLKSGLTLNEGENLVMELEAEFFAGSSNPIAQFIGNVQKLILKILGTRLKGYLVITDQRVVEVYSYVRCYIFNVSNRCYIFNVSKTVKCLLPSSIKEVGYKKQATCGFFCPAYYLYYDAHTQHTEIQLSAFDEGEASKVVDAFFKAIAKAQK